MMKISELLFLCLCCGILTVIANELNPYANNVNTNDLIDNQIKLIKSRIQQTPDTKQNSMQNADLWRRLGLLLQTKDVRQHTGGGILQPEILEAFDKAIKLNDDRDSAMSFQVYEHRGMLLKMMGRGEEAIADHDLAIEFAATNVEKCDAMSNKAAALVMLGRVQRATSLYRETLDLCPDKLSFYLPLVQCLQELGTYNTSDWESLLVDIELALFSPNKSKLISSSSDSMRLSDGGDGVPEDGLETADDDDARDIANQKSMVTETADQSYLRATQGSGVYWALFEVIMHLFKFLLLLLLLTLLLLLIGCR